MTGLTEAKGASLEIDDDLASTANGKGASLVAIEDAAGNFTGANVEDALAELVTDHFLSAVIAKTTNYTVVAGDRNAHMTVTGTSTITLLPAATAGDGFAILISNIGAGIVTIDGDGTETIKGALTLDLAVDDWAILTCDGTNWAAAISVDPLVAADLSTYVQQPIDRLLQYYGDDSDGAFASIGASTLSDFLYDHTTFLLNSGHTITIDTPVCIIRATTSIVIDGDINGTGTLIAAGAGATMGRLGDSLGSSGGGGGAGGAGYDAILVAIQIKPEDGEDGDHTHFALGGAGGVATTGNGGDGSIGIAPAANQKALITSLLSSLIARGGGRGGDGSKGGYGLQSDHTIDYPSAAGVGGLAGTLLILIAPSITIDAAATIDLTGQAGTNAATVALTSGGSGGGGGGAGGVLVKVSPSITDAGTTTVTAGAAGTGVTGGSGADGGDGNAGAAGYSYEIDPTI